MVALVSEEGAYTGGSVRSVVVSEFSEGKECGPIILLVGNVVSEILFEGLINPFGLPIAFRVITGSEVELNRKRLTESAKKCRNKFQSLVRGNMAWNSVF